ncbi:7256_t:CDS:2, partial [Racocetra fulgida]
AEMKRMDQEFQDVKQEYLNDLDRIRAKRNELASYFNNIEILDCILINGLFRMLANDRMEFIHILKEEIRKLNIKIAAFEGNKNSIEHIRNVQLTPNELSFRESQGTDIAKDDKLLRSNQNSPTMDSQQPMDVKELIKKIKELELMNDILKKSWEIESLFNQLEQRDDANHKKAFEICTQDQRVYTLKQSENHSNEASTTAQTLTIYKQKLQEFELEIKRYKIKLRRRDEEQRAVEKELRHVKEQLEVKKEQMEELRRNVAAVPSETQRLLEAYE